MAKTVDQESARNIIAVMETLIEQVQRGEQVRISLAWVDEDDYHAAVHTPDGEWLELVGAHEIAGVAMKNAALQGAVELFLDDDNDGEEGHGPN